VGWDRLVEDVCQAKLMIPAAAATQPKENMSKQPLALDRTISIRMHLPSREHLTLRSKKVSARVRKIGLTLLSVNIITTGGSAYACQELLNAGKQYAEMANIAIAKSNGAAGRGDKKAQCGYLREAQKYMQLNERRFQQAINCFGRSTPTLTRSMLNNRSTMNEVNNIAASICR
jgi:hypothetical protein